MWNVGSGFGTWGLGALERGHEYSQEKPSEAFPRPYPPLVYPRALVYPVPAVWLEPLRGGGAFGDQNFLSARGQPLPEDPFRTILPQHLPGFRENREPTVEVLPARTEFAYGPLRINLDLQAVSGNAMHPTLQPMQQVVRGLTHA